MALNVSLAIKKSFIGSVSFAGFPNLRWEYPRTQIVLRKAGLHTISEYIGQRRSHIARKIADRPVLAECQGAERRRGTPRRQYWWEQDLEAELPPLEGVDEADEPEGL